MIGAESVWYKQFEKPELLVKMDEIPNQQELSNDMENNGKTIVEPPDVLFIERISRAALLEQYSLKNFERSAVEDVISSDGTEIKSEGLTEEEKTKIKEETGWSDEIIENIKNMDQYEVLKNAGLIEAEINGRKCLIKENLDLDTPIKDAYGRIKTNRERITDGNAPIDIKTGKPLQLHHLGQKIDSPLVELTEEEHRTGEYKDGKKNQSLWHDNVVETEVHGKGNTWATVRGDHWTERVKQLDGGIENEYNN